MTKEQKYESLRREISYFLVRILHFQVIVGKNFGRFFIKSARKIKVRNVYVKQE